MASRMRSTTAVDRTRDPVRRGRAPGGRRRRAPRTAARARARLAASGRRPSSGIRGIRSASGTSIQTDTPSRLMSARLSGSANVPPPVATTTWRIGWSEPEDLALDAAEVRLAVPREDVGDRQPLAPLDQVVDVLDAPAQPRRQRARDRALAARHEADEIDLVGRHATQPRQVPRERRIRHRDRVGAGDERRPRARRAPTSANAMTSR